ncbi:fatty acid-binding protein, heart-like [Arctopsyche grandis]|uniref:fatty acid-binding protein, heart-like n=1 Tax=Arctopsyche grandis TaxID=121162 RepID=UPI00406DA0B7
MEAYLNKKYRLTKSENFDEFMKKMGVGLIARKMVGLLTPTVELQKSGEEYTLLTVSTFRTMVLKFKLGVEFDELKPDGRSLKTVITLDGNKMKQLQKVDDIDVIIMREFTDNELNVVMTAGNIVSTRVFTVVEN